MMENKQSYRNLEIYRLAHELAVATHQFSVRLPKYETYESGSQLRRASKSVAANIVEGFCRRKYKAEYIRFLIYAHGSCNESVEWLELIRDCHSSFSDDATQLIEQFNRRRQAKPLYTVSLRSTPIAQVIPYLISHIPYPTSQISRHALIPPSAQATVPCPGNVQSPTTQKLRSPNR